MNAQQLTSICKAISASALNTAEANMIVDAVKVAHDRQVSQTATKFTVGDKVWFSDRRTGMKVTGTVTKVNRKTVKVLSDAEPGRLPGSWNVTPTLLKRQA